MTPADDGGRQEARHEWIADAYRQLTDDYEHGNRRTPWPVFAAGMCLWTVALGVTAVVVAADRLATRFLNGGN